LLKAFPREFFKLKALPDLSHAMTPTEVRRPSLAFRVRRRALAEIDSAWGAFLGKVRPTPNDRCLRIFALRRSGQHAVINWIRYQLAGRHWFLNDCRAGESPFAGAQFHDSVVRGVWGEHKVFHQRRELRGTHSYKGSFLYNYEDLDLREVPTRLPLADETMWVGRSGARNDVLILRDPFNLIASRLKWAYGSHDRPSKPSLEGMSDSVMLWKVYAREFTGRTEYLSNGIAIGYNRWFADRDYRDGLAQRLGFDNREIGVSEVARWGPSVSSDSFDGLKFDGRAQDMKVLSRWRQFENDPLFRRLVADPELHELSREIFGEIPGTEALT
jgi:hypothetical protein